MVEVGPIVHFWCMAHLRMQNTTALCVGTKAFNSSCDSFQILCASILPSWFQIKSKHKLTDGPKNLFDLYKRIQNFPNLKVKNIALKVIERNAYFAHPENILLGMLADPDESIRKAAVDKIVHIRNHGAKATEWLKKAAKTWLFFVLRWTQINCKAQSYHDRANIDAEEIAQAPLLQSLSFMEIQDLRGAPLKASCPCHNQAVKRHFKLVTEASSITTGFASRNGLIKQRIKSRHLMKIWYQKTICL